MKRGDKLRVCLAASAGGHISQLLKIAGSSQRYHTFCVTTSEIVREKLREYGKVYVVGECNRQHLLKSLLVLLRCIRITFKELPDVVISTGAAPGGILCLVSKILGAKIVWVDSIANVERLSLSGRLIRPVADLFLTQWPEVAEKYSNVEYIGAVI